MERLKALQRRELLSTSARFRHLATALLISVSLLGGESLAQIETAVVDTPGGGGVVSDVQVNAFLSLTRMSFNDTATLTLRLSWEKGEFTLSDKSAPQLGLQRLRVGSVSSRAFPLGGEEKGRVAQEFVYTLLPTASGKAIVRPVKFRFFRQIDSKPGSVTTPELSVTVLMPAPEREEAQTDWRVVALVLLVFMGAVAIAVTVVLKKRHRQRAEKRRLAEWNRLSEALGALKTATSGSKAEFFDRLYEFLYALLSDAGYISARKGDSDSVMAELQEVAIAEEIKRPLINWLARSSSEKFSPGRGTPGESLRVYYEVEAFIRERWRSTDEANRRPDTGRSSGRPAGN